MVEGVLSPEGIFYKTGLSYEKELREAGWLPIHEDYIVPIRLTDRQLRWLMSNLGKLNRGQNDSLSRILLYYM